MIENNSTLVIKQPLFGKENEPCFTVAIKEATKNSNLDILDVNFDDNGYCSISEAKKKISNIFSYNLRYKYFKRGTRFELNKFHIKGKFIILTLGHFVYVEDLVVYSFYNNLDDKIVAFWEII